MAAEYKQLSIPAENFTRLCEFRDSVGFRTNGDMVSELIDTYKSQQEGSRSVTINRRTR